ncbi:hypothetical protein EAI6_41110 [Enterobacter asburiae]|nr:hypothetical protein EAI6_41110 [Enterobacter asburiae]
MIYVITNNNFLRIGLINCLHPLVLISVYHDKCLDKINDTVSNVFIVDDSITFNPSYKRINFNSKNNTIIFINTNKEIEPNFLKVNSRCHMLERSLTLKEIKSEILKIMSGKIKVTVRNTKTMLSQREKDVLLASMMGLSVHEIALRTNLQDKTVYHYRKNACLKLGVPRFLDMIAIRNSFLIALSIVDADSTKLDEDCFIL